MPVVTTPFVGYVEQWGTGTGTRRVAKLLEAAGLPPAQYTELPPGRFRVEVSRHPTAVPTLSKAEATLMEVVAASQHGAATSTLVTRTGRSERWVRQHARALVDRGLLAVEGAGPQRKYVLPR